MNYFLLTITVIILSIQSSHSQKKWFVSPVLGVNMTALKEIPEDLSYQKAGISFGALTGPVINEHWRMNFGLTFNQRYTGYSYEEPSQSEGLIADLIGNLIGGFDLGGTDFVDVKTEYWTVDIPLIMDYTFSSGFFFCGGLYLNSVISASNDVKTTSHIPILELIDLSDLGLGIIESLLPQNGTFSTSSNSKEGLNSTNLGLTGGFGADVGKVQLRMQYQYGFGAIRSDEFSVGVKNQQTISFHLAYLFNPAAGSGSSRLKPRYDLELIK